MIITRLYSDFKFDSPQKTAGFFACVEKYNKILSINKFGNYEPLNNNFTDFNDSLALEMLLGNQKCGDIIFKGKRNKFMCWIRWTEICVSEWIFWMDEALFHKHDEWSTYLEFIFELSKEYNIVFGGIATEEEWRMKNWEINIYEDESEDEMKMGLDGINEKYFPGIYWITIFGHRLKQPNFQEKDRLEPFSISNKANLNWGTILRLDESPFTYQSKERIQNDLWGTKLIGEDYFFDIKSPSRKLIKIEY